MNNVNANILVILLLGFFSDGLKSESFISKPSELLRIHGSNTIGEKFAPALIKGFLQQEKFTIRNTSILNTKIERNIKAQQGIRGRKLNVELFSHGSSTGFKDLWLLKTDVVMSSRPIKEKEIKAISKLYPSIVDKKTEHVIAYDALAIIVNSNQMLTNISLDKLAKIFSGEFINWKELGGKDLPIKVLSRDNNSGTYDTFKNLVLKPFKKSLTVDSLRFESSSALANRVENTVGAIGFIGISHTGNNKVLAISSSGQGNGILPNFHTIGTEDYPLSRKLSLYLPLEVENPTAHKFVSYVESNAGQLLAERSQLISYFPTKSRPRLKSKGVKNKFKNLRTFGHRLSVTFRLNEGYLGAKFDRDLQRLVSYSEHNPYQKIVLAGFWDDPSSRLKSQNNVQKWMDELETKLLNRAISPWKIQAGFLPIENNSIEDGKAVNRRVEVWVL